ncbi:YqjF family protein [Streptomyces sp. NPDC057854]|uniref:YqjF family protein n=1 Tax=unclassified Streptomyces TaxID=2593676 RepID=UPI0036ABF82D
MSRTAPRPLPGLSFRQEWHDLLFVHWAVSPGAVAGFFPPGTRPDTFDGRTFVGLVFFEMRELAFARGPALPVLGRFPEINVRLYSVDGHGRRGVVFLSLDCPRLLPVLAARAAYRLPYHWASARRLRFDDRMLYTVRRRCPGGPRSRVWADVAGGRRDPDALDDFLTARWGLHAPERGGTYFWPLWHDPWRLCEAALLSLDDELVAAATGGLPVARSAPPVSVLYSAGLHVRFGARLPVRGS